VSGCRKKGESQENDFKDAVSVCLPLVNAAIKDVEKGTFPKSCFLNIEIPTSPLSNKVSKFYYIVLNFCKCFAPLCKCELLGHMLCEFSVHDNILG